MRGSGLLHEPLKAPAGAARHRDYGRVRAAFLKKERVDQMAGRQFGFAHEITDGGRLAVATGADRKVHLPQLLAERQAKGKCRIYVPALSD